MNPSKKMKLLIVDDDEQHRDFTKELLRCLGYDPLCDIQEASGEIEAVTISHAFQPDAVLLDLELGPTDRRKGNLDLGGLRVLQHLRKKLPGADVFIFSVVLDEATMVACKERGARGYVSKPINEADLVFALKSVLDRLGIAPEPKPVVLPGLKKITDQIERVAPTEMFVLLSGPPGVGKELAARLIHEKSNRAKGVFSAVNCSAVMDTLFESEFFGIQKGAANNVTADRIGWFEGADGGTLFLDEVGELKPDHQAKFNRVLQLMEVTRVGESVPRKIDVRIISATNRDLAAAVRNGSFRKDLFDRLATYVIDVPPLKERIDDLEWLVPYCLAQLKGGVQQPWAWTDDAMKKLKGYSWPGNIRELINVLGRAAVDAPERFIRPEHIALPVCPPPEANAALAEGLSLDSPLDENFKQLANNQFRLLKEHLKKVNPKTRVVDVLAVMRVSKPTWYRTWSSEQPEEGE